MKAELRYESAEYVTRKPANRHFNVARPQYPRPKTSQVMASNGLVFYVVSVVAIGTLTKWLMVGGQQASGVPFVITATAKKIKHSLLADLIIDKVLINSASPRIDTILSSESRHVRRWFAYVIVNKGLTSVGADEMCGGSKHRY